MESTLFWIGCGLGAYGVVLRKIFQRERWIQNQALITLLHLLFTVSVGALIGFVYSASTDLQGPSPEWPLLGAGVGLVWGITQALWGRSKSGNGTRLLTSDLEWIETSFSAILLASVIMYAILQAFKIPSGSMQNTLLEGDHLFVNKFIYGIRIPFTEKRILRIRPIRHGDVIVFEAPLSAMVSARERSGVFEKISLSAPSGFLAIRSRSRINAFMSTACSTRTLFPFTRTFRPTLPPNFAWAPSNTSGSGKAAGLPP